MTAYTRAAQTFVADHGCTPLDVLHAPSDFGLGTQLRAAFLNAWDVWLFEGTAHD